MESYKHPNLKELSKGQTAVSISSGAHAYLLERWATFTGRSVSNLCAYLLEGAINDALEKGAVPVEAVLSMQDAIKEMKEEQN